MQSIQPNLILSTLAIVFFAFSIFLFPQNSYATPTFSLLHTFTDGASDGRAPGNGDGSPIISGGKIYDMTFVGGSSSAGIIFSMNLDGTGFTILHTFTGGGSDGANPSSSLTLSGSTLYGMTNGGGASSLGVIFSMNLDGTGFTILHSFVGGVSDGRNPGSLLKLSGSTFYGMTGYGGASDQGVIFSMNVDGTGFTLLHTFTGGASDGSYPRSAPTLSGSKLYGNTVTGGASNLGVIFSMNLDGTGFTILHTLTGAVSDGGYGKGSLTLSGSKLYGVADGGGTSNRGVIYSINPDGTGFTILHSFIGGATDGSYPESTLVLSGSTLYGTTESGGASNKGVIYSINLDGTGHTLLHTLTGGASDGQQDDSSVTLFGTTLYGETNRGGASNFGVTFALIPDFAPTVTTTPATSLTTTSATLNGNITASGGASITARGFNYGSTTSYGTDITESSGPYSTGVFSADITRLDCNTTYNFRAYATNSVGTAYGDNATFTTSACPFYGGGGRITPPPTSTPPPIVPPITPPTDCYSTYLFSPTTGQACPTTVIPPTDTQSSIPNTFQFLNNLSIKMIHPDVKELQIYLNTHGFILASVGPGSPGNETYKFGLLTHAALIKFQQAKNITPAVGFFGPITRGVVNASQ